MNILVLNSGSSSQKACLFALGDLLPEVPPKPLWEGKMEWRESRAMLDARNFSGAVSRQELERTDRVEATAQLLKLWFRAGHAFLGTLARST